MALGLSDLASKNVSIETLFIDADAACFGSLDDAWPDEPAGVSFAACVSDPRCPRPGVEAAVDAARAALRGWGADERRLGLHWDESVAAAPLPAAEWKAGHVITDAMFEQVERFLSDRLTEPAPDP